MNIRHHDEAPASASTCPPTSVSRSPAPLHMLWAAAALCLVSACGGGGGGDDAPAPPPPAPAPPAGSPPTAPSTPPRATTINSSLSSPWGLAFLPDGRMLITQKSGSMVIVSAGGGSKVSVTGVPSVATGGQGGLLDVVLDPDFATTPWIYFSYSEAGSGSGSNPAGTAVARAQLVGNALQNLTVIFRQSPKVTANNHFGARLAFRSDKTLFITLGERQTYDSANLTATREIGRAHV